MSLGRLSLPLSLTSSQTRTSYPSELLYYSQLLINRTPRWQNPRMCTCLVISKNLLRSAISHTVFGPLMADTEWTHPLGKCIGIRIDRECISPRLYTGYSSLSPVEGCRLPPLENRSADTDCRRVCYVGFDYIAPSGQSLSFLNPCVRDRGHFRTQCNGTRRSTCESGDAIHGRLLFTTAYRRISKCFELSTMRIGLRSECDEEDLDWDTYVLVRDILSKPASMPICLSSGQG